MGFYQKTFFYEIFYSPVSDVFDAELSIAFMDTVGTIRKK